MVGSNDAGVSPVMSFMISSRWYPTARRAAIFAIGKPVALLANADDDDVVGVVAHELELVLLPSRDRLLDEDLPHRAGGEAALGDVLHLLGVGGEARAAASQDERWPHDDRVAHLRGHVERLRHAVR